MYIKICYDKMFTYETRKAHKMIEGEVLKRYELSLDDILPQIMETIIEVYGERHRKQIEDNFKRAYLKNLA